MKVLKPGKPWSKECACTGQGNGGGGCKATLEVEMGDLFRTHSSHYDGSSESYLTFKCPECGILTDVTEIPTAIDNMIGMRTKPLNTGMYHGPDE